MKKFMTLCIVAAVSFVSLGFNIERAQAGTYSKQLITNGNFESGTTGWSEMYSQSGEDLQLCTGCIVNNFGLTRWHSGNWGAYLGGYSDWLDMLAQFEVVLPSNAKQIDLSYYYWFSSSDLDDTDYGHIIVSDSVTSDTLADKRLYPSTDDNTTNSWVKGSLNLSSLKGKTVDVVFDALNDDDSNITNFYVDDVSLLATFDDFSRPTGTISINNGASSTTNRYVTLYTKATDTGSGVRYMRFSNNGSKWTGWKTYARTYKNWNMTSSTYGGTTTKGTKTVYVQFKDRAGNISSTKHDHIVYR